MTIEQGPKSARITRWLTALVIGILLTPGAALFGTLLLLLIAPLVRPDSLPGQWSLILLFGVAGGSLYAAPTTILGLPLVVAAADPRKTLRRRKLIAAGFAFGVATMVAIVAGTRDTNEALGVTALGIVLVGGASGGFAGLALGQLLKNRFRLPA